MRRPRRHSILPAQPDDILLWTGAARGDLVPAVVLGRDRSGALRLHCREYYRTSIGRLVPKGGVSIPLDQYRAMNRRLEAALAELEGNRPLASGA